MYNKKCCCCCCCCQYFFLERKEFSRKNFRKRNKKKRDLFLSQKAEREKRVLSNREATCGRGKTKQRTWSFNSIKNDRLTADGLERSDGGVYTSRQQVLRLLEDPLWVVSLKSRLGDGDDFLLLMATLSRSDGGRNLLRLSAKLRGNVARGNSKHVLCVLLGIVVNEFRVNA